MENTTILPEDNCPVCKKKFDRASPPGDEQIQPVPGDYTVCIGCGAMLKFDPDMKHVLIGNKELTTMPEDTFNQLFNLSMTIMQNPPK